MGSTRHAAFRLVANHALLLLTVLLIVLFSVLLPRTFPSVLTAQSILSDKAIVAFLGLAEMVVISANQFDLSVGYMVSLLHSLAIGLMVAGLPWPLVCLLTLGIGLAIGLLNGVLVRFAKIDSFIATLGVGTVAYGLAGWYSGGEQIIGDLPHGFTALDSTRVLGLPLSALLLLVLAAVMWVVFEFLPTGRYLYVIGANERTARADGHPRQPLRDRRVLRLWAHHGVRVPAARSPHPGRAKQCRAGVSLARLRGCVAGRHHGATGPGERVGHGDRGVDPGRSASPASSRWEAPSTSSRCSTAPRW